MTESKIYPVILAGGNGTRLWPLSNNCIPKQFVPLFELSLFQMTVQRFQTPIFNPVVIVCNRKHIQLIKDQLYDIQVADYVILPEPIGRDTAPAIGLATLVCLKEDSQAQILLVPSDHYIPQVDKLLELIQQGQSLCHEYLTLFGIHPTCPETGYGYIQRGQRIQDEIYQVSQFIEKPKLQRAIELLSDGRYYWNSGIYLFAGSLLIEEMTKFQPKLVQQLTSYVDQFEDRTFEEIRPISLDYAITEKSDRVAVIKSNITWSDLGSWSNMWQVAPKDSLGNFILGPVVAHKTTNSYLRSQKSMVVIGLNNIVAIETDEAILILDQAQSQEVKYVVQ